MTPLRVGLLYGLGALVFVAGSLNLTMGGWLNWYRLAREGRRTAATITRVEPRNHQRCHFEYSVHAARYQGLKDGCQAAVGDTLTVTYSPAEPSFVTGGSPAGELGVQVIGSVVMAMLAGLAAALHVRRRSRRSVDEGAAQQSVAAAEARKEHAPTDPLA